MARYQGRQTTLSGALLGLLLCSAAAAGVERPALEITPVTERVYTAVGATLPPSRENWGHNNNLSFVIGDAGVLVVNGGDNYRLAEALHAEIRRLTDLPVRWLVDENGQGHAFLGNAYWHEQGVTIIAHADAAKEIEEHGAQSLQAMLERNGARGEGTHVVAPDRTFTDGLTLDLGGVSAELIWFGNAHSPGDISVWIANENVLIAGDIAFHERLLGIFPDTDVAAWIASLKRLLAMQPEILVPGHGRPTDAAAIEKYTLNYLEFLVAEVSAILERDGDLAEAYAIDQSAYAHLDTFDELAAKNAGRVYQQLEWALF